MSQSRFIECMCIPHVDDDDGNISSPEFGRVPPSGGNLYYTNGESSDTVWPGMYV